VNDSYVLFIHLFFYEVFETIVTKSVRNTELFLKLVSYALF